MVTDKNLAANVKRSLEDGTAAGIDATVKVRAANSEKLLKSIFHVLKNTHYGAYSTWKANVSNATRHEAIIQSKKKTRVFGTIQPDDAHLDGAWDNCWLDLHADNSYFEEPPKIQGFGCLFLTPQTHGGLTTLCDGLKIADVIKKDYPAAYKLLTEVPVQGGYIKEGQNLIAARPVLRLDPNTGNLKQITFNNGDRVSIRPCKELPTRSAMEAMYDAYALVHKIAHDPQYHIRFQLKPGAILCFDNHRLLHGRTAFSGPRVMGGAYIGLDDYNSSVKCAMVS